MLNFKRYFFIFAFLSITFCGGYAHAQAFDENEYTDTEKTGLAFYKFSNTAPNFEKWIKEYEYYKMAKPSKKNLILHEDGERLNRGLQGFQPDIHYITFITKARLHIPNEQDRGRFLEQYKKVPLRIELPRILEIPGSQETYFPYYIGGVWFALIPDSFQNFVNIYMDAEEYYEFAKNLNTAYGANSQTVTIEYTLRATSADTQEPFPIGSNDFWLIMAEIGSIVILDSDRKSQAWSYEAPWFIPKTRQDLMNLFKQ